MLPIPFAVLEIAGGAITQRRQVRDDETRQHEAVKIAVRAQPRRRG
ncbi:MAG TPA: hypothetical protein H9871_11445 [Candidatus Nesterenkonia stercoripullorum]|uniref:Uncharacterized protein n=1 Tax=Candidatus Nesterenkonia stercoripullorum TaxID=2838701 RepID=A0A9D1UUL9_9MICC|nr:hypothetical protein [Candidatus Nesterenkonia stercoripullorum]